MRCFLIYCRKARRYVRVKGIGEPLMLFINHIDAVNWGKDFWKCSEDELKDHCVIEERLMIEKPVV